MLIKKSLKVFLFVIFSFSFLKSSMAQDLPDSIVKQLDKISSKMMTATLEDKKSSIIDYYADDIVIMPDFQPALRGKQTLSNAYNEERKKGLKYHSFNGVPEKRWMVADDVFERGTFGMSVSTKDDPKPKAYYGSYFQIWEKQSGGSYKISYIIWNLDFNPF